MQEHDKQIPIWFFIGGLLALYGVLIAAAGVYEWLHPPPPEKMVKLWNLHADIWWGALMAIFGAIYVVRFWPSKAESLTGKLDHPDPTAPAAEPKG